MSQWYTTMLKFKKKIKRIESIIFSRVSISNILIFLLALLIISATFVSNIISTVGENRVDLLKQIAENGARINKAAQFAMDNIYRNVVYNLLTNDEAQNDELNTLIKTEFDQQKRSFESLDIQLSLIILMKNDFEYLSSYVTQKDINAIKSSFWYIDNFSNEKNQFWMTNFGWHDDRAAMEISYVKILRDSNWEYQGIMIIGSREKAVYDVYADILEENNNVFIVDETGTIISHSNKHMIGTQMYYMKSFFEENVKNSYSIKKIAGKNVLFTNYYDRNTGWTIVEEYSIYNIIKNNCNILVIAFVMFISLILISLINSRIIARKISKPIERFTADLSVLSDTTMQISEVQKGYKEIYSMTIAFNRQVKKMHELIERIKFEEMLKRKTELKFLQAQINPHLLHNTLFTIKCMIDLKKSEQASEMLDLFIKLLKAPINIDDQMIKLKEEIDYLKNYIQLMEYRYGGKIKLIVDISKKNEDIQVPRMILQPIVENAIFHGFGDRDEGGEIKISVESIDDRVKIKIKDNGVGMTSRQLSAIWENKSKNKRRFSSIGLKNVNERIKIIYGLLSGIEISSSVEHGTEVTIRLIMDGGRNDENSDNR